MKKLLALILLMATSANLQSATLHNLSGAACYASGYRGKPNGQLGSEVNFSELSFPCTISCEVFGGDRIRPIGRIRYDDGTDRYIVKDRQGLPSLEWRPHF